METMATERIYQFAHPRTVLQIQWRQVQSVEPVQAMRYELPDMAGSTLQPNRTGKCRQRGPAVYPSGALLRAPNAECGLTFEREAAQLQCHKQRYIPRVRVQRRLERERTEIHPPRGGHFFSQLLGSLTSFHNNIHQAIKR